MRFLPVVMALSMPVWATQADPVSENMPADNQPLVDERFEVDLGAWSLVGAESIEIIVDPWYRFRLDVAAQRASLYLVDMDTPVRTFDWIHKQGAFGFEARPGGGEPVWVDGSRFAGGGLFVALVSAPK